MVRASSSVLIAAVAVGLTGCGDDISRSFGITRDTPDEFTVTTRAPLSIPPDFALRPPRPGAPRPQEQDAPDAAEATLVPQAALEGTEPGAAPSLGQQALVAQAGPAAPANIRQKIEHDSALDQPSQSLTDRLMFWKPAPLPGVVVDPTKESDRLRTNAALGQAPTIGNTPIIQRQSSGGGLFNGLF